MQIHADTHTHGRTDKRGGHARSHHRVIRSQSVAKVRLSPRSRALEVNLIFLFILFPTKLACTMTRASSGTPSTEQPPSPLRYPAVAEKSGTAMHARAHTQTHTHTHTHTVVGLGIYDLYGIDTHTHTHTHTHNTGNTDTSSHEYALHHGTAETRHTPTPPLPSLPTPGNNPALHAALACPSLPPSFLPGPTRPSRRAHSTVCVCVWVCFCVYNSTV